MKYNKPMDVTILDWFEHQAQNVTKNNEMLSDDDNVSDNEFFIENILNDRSKQEVKVSEKNITLSEY